MKRLLTTAAAAAFLLGAAPASAATLFIGDKATNLALFNAALSGAATQTQDFEGFADGANLFGVNFLPGTTATTNAARLEVFQGSGDKEMFALDGTTRANGNLFYEILVGSFNAFAFDIEAFDPATPGPGVLEIFFSDLSSQLVNIFPTNATESTPIFVGIVSPLDIVRILWREGPEINGTGNEETAFDNFIAAEVDTPEVPLPGAVWLFGSAIAGFAASARRKQNA